jgi:hypothetical protein
VDVERLKAEAEERTFDHAARAGSRPADGDALTGGEGR